MPKTKRTEKTTLKIGPDFFAQAIILTYSTWDKETKELQNSIAFNLSQLVKYYRERIKPELPADTIDRLEQRLKVKDSDAQQEVWEMSAKLAATQGGYF